MGAGEVPLKLEVAVQLVAAGVSSSSNTRRQARIRAVKVNVHILELAVIFP